MIITDMPHVTTKNQIVNALGYTPANQEDVLLKGEVDGRNLFVMGNSEVGYIEVGQPDGVVHAVANGERISEFIPVSEGDVFTLQSWATAFDVTYAPYMIDYCWYSEKDGSKNIGNSIRHIGGVSSAFNHAAITTNPAPHEAKYMRVDARLYLDGKIKVERGTIATPWTPAPEDVVTKTPYDIFEALDGIPEMHRNLYRGRNLGESTAMSAAHKVAIQNGSFKDLFVGDYWTHDGINYRIADMDYFYNCGDTNFTTHHLVIVPDKCLGENKPMNESGKTEGGYHGSEMYTTTLPSIKTTYIDKAFPSLVLTHKEYLTNAVTEGHPSGGGWFESTVELMNEIMVYGCPVFTSANTGATVPTLYTIDNSQLALFQLNPRMIKTRYNYWLRDVVSASDFAVCDRSGLAYCASASNIYSGVRPVFCIGVAPTGDEADDDMEVVSPMQEGDYMEEEFE